VPREVGKAYVADEGSDTVSVVDETRIASIATIALPAPAGRRPHSMSSSPDGRLVYVGESGSNVVDVIDTSSDRIAARFAAGEPGSGIRAAIADGSGDYLYALSRDDKRAMSTFAAIEAATGKWVWALQFGDAAEDAVIAADGRTAFVSVPARNAIRVVDLATHDIAGDLHVAGTTPETLTLCTDGRTVTAASAGSNRIAVIGDQRIARTIEITDGGPAARSLSGAEVLCYLTDSVGEGVISIDLSGAIARRFRMPGGGVSRAAVVDPH
ncbi:MAG TPA: hypothetical protein VIW26_10460, partial [Gemmatimonadales bacterium]